jgi:hypothetical protein
MLLDTLRADQLAARKAKNATKAALLTTLVAEAARVGKDAGNRDSTDDEVLKTIQKFVKNAGDTRAALVSRDGSADALKTVDEEIAILNAYLPKQLSDKELTRLIEDFVQANPGAQMKDVMGFLSREHKGTYNGKSANVIATEVIKQAREG